jgi:chemotaxis protein methyltransferase CheR
VVNEVKNDYSSAPQEFIEDIEIELLLDGIFRRYGHDFRGYARESIKRRVQVALTKSGCKNISQMLERTLRDPDYFRTLVSDLTVNVTEMFRDPEVYLMIRKQIVPILKTYPSIKIWHAGCATGEEVYSMAILLQEEGLYDKSLLYATDISPRALEKAKAGIYAADQLQLSTSNYQKSGGIEPFTNYYTAKYGSVKMNGSLQKNIVFAQHNLVTDDVFSEFQLILCRNVLIYFERPLQSRVLDLFYRSLSRRGFLCLGTKETVEYSSMEKCFETLHKQYKLHRKI